MNRCAPNSGSVARRRYTAEEVHDQLNNDDSDDEMTFEADYPDSEIDSRQ